MGDVPVAGDDLDTGARRQTPPMPAVRRLTPFGGRLRDLLLRQGRDPWRLRLRPATL